MGDRRNDVYIESVVVAGNVIVRYRAGNRRKPIEFDFSGYVPQETINELVDGAKRKEFEKFGEDWCEKFTVLPVSKQDKLLGIEQKFLEEIAVN